MNRRIKASFKPLLKPNYLPVTLVLLFILLLVVYFFMKDRKEGFECKVDELNTRMASSEKTLVLFYADWCGHCKNLEPVWDECTKKSKGRMVKRNVGAKDVDKKTEAENQALMDKYQINGFPTILVFQNGTATPYKGERTVEAFLDSLE
jgi:thiol-disulfide isomerase/thioredoxin